MEGIGRREREGKENRDRPLTIFGLKVAVQHFESFWSQKKQTGIIALPPPSCAAKIITVGRSYISKYIPIGNRI